MVPLPRWQPVARPRLLGLLDEGTRGPLTLLAAPAGYGKTLLLTSWADDAGRPGEPSSPSAGESPRSGEVRSPRVPTIGDGGLLHQFQALGLELVEVRRLPDPPRDPEITRPG